MKKGYLFIIIFFLVNLLLLFSCTKDKPFTYSPKAYIARFPQAIEEKIGPFTSGIDNLTTEEGIFLGRKLFYDTRLSGDNSVACSNCHQQQFAFADSKEFSDGIEHIPTGRNSPTIFNQAWSKHFFWDGRRKSLETQAHDPITSATEMNGNWDVIIERLQNDNIYPILFYQAFGSGLIDSISITKAIAQFERSLISYNSKFDQFYATKDSSLLSASELRGFEIFLHRGTCNACHTLPLGHLNAFFSIGLEKGIEDSGLAKITGLASDIGKFKSPSIRNLSYSAPYMHNGKFKTIREVLNFYNNDINERSPNIDSHLMPLFNNRGSLSTQDIADLEHFLMTLNDESFIHNPSFSNPSIK